MTVTLPANRGTITDRNGVPLAESVDGLMIVADPTMTAKHASEIATILARRLVGRLLRPAERLRKPDTQFQYIARRVPVDEGPRRRRRRSTSAGFKGIDTRRDPVRDYPAKDVAANLVGFMNANGDAGEGAELMFDHDAVRQGRLGDLRGTAAATASRSATTAPSTPQSGHDLALTIDRDVQWYTQRVRAPGRPGQRRLVRRGRRDGHPAPASCSASRTTRRSTPTSRRCRPRATSARAPCATSTSPARSRRCSPPSSLIDAGKVTPSTRITRAAAAAARRPGDPRLLPARHAPPDADRRDREVLQHRHGAGRAASSSTRQLYHYLRKLRPRPAAPASACSGETRRRAAATGRAGADQPGHDRLRPGRRGQRRADGRGRQRDRQRRRLRRSPA